MAYPAPPWRLKGNALNTLHLVDCARARALVPPGLKIIQVLPGRTLGVLYLGRYGPGSVLEYSELIVAAALVRSGRRPGFWISHIYVDNFDSMAGGQEIWGLPKELARFAWEAGEPGCVTVSQGDQVLCTLKTRRPRSLLRWALQIPTYSRLDANLLFFKGLVNARLGLAGARLEVPRDSPFSTLGLGRGGFVLDYREMVFLACEPEKVRQTG